MKKFDKFQNMLEKAMTPIIDVIGKNKSIQALTKGFMNTLPISLGVVVLAVLINLPFEGWQTFLANTKLQTAGMELISSTLSLLAIYALITISYSFTQQEGENALIGTIVTLGAFLAMMPVYTAEIDGAQTSVFLTANMGSSGIFVAMILVLIIPRLYCKLMKKNIRIKLPDSVPPMVSDSLSPSIASVIIFTGVFFVKWAFTLTPWGDIFSFVTDVISKPIMFFGASPISLILFYTFCNLLWFFGIHPNPLTNTYHGVVMVAALTANIEAFVAGEPLPYMNLFIVLSCIYIGGNGNTLGLCLSMLFAKSEKYKSMRKLVIVPNIFNINEPIIFGFPLMLNPIYFIPMVTTSLISGFVALGLTQIIPVAYNPTISMSWVVPGFIVTFLRGGIPFLGIWLICLGIHFILYLPFFKMDDNKTYKEEQELARQKGLHTDIA